MHITGLKQFSEFAAWLLHACLYPMSTLRCLLHPAGRVISLPARCAYSAPAPALAPAAQFHSPAALQARKLQTRDGNKNRGVSAIHRRYPKDPLSVSKVPLPEPEAAEEKRAEMVDTGHGLYGFFRDGKVLPAPEEDYRHGTDSAPHMFA